MRCGSGAWSFMWIRSVDGIAIMQTNTSGVMYLLSYANM